MQQLGYTPNETHPIAVAEFSWHFIILRDNFFSKQAEIHVSFRCKNPTDQTDEQWSTRAR